MHLEGHAGAQRAAREFGVDFDHCQLDYIGGRALQRSIHCSALGEAAHVGILAVDVGDWTNAAKQSSYTLLAAGLVEHAINVGADTLVSLEVRLRVPLGLFL